MTDAHDPSPLDELMSWDKFPHVRDYAPARRFLTRWSANRDPKTIEAYARGQNLWLAHCARWGVDPAAATDDDVALWIITMKKQGQVVSLETGSAVSAATVKQRLTAVRLLYDDLVRKGKVTLHPVPRGVFQGATHGRGTTMGGRLHRAPDTALTPGGRPLVPNEQRLPWIPMDHEWLAFLEAAREEPLRNRVMLLFAYDCALRRETVVGLEVRDLDFAHRAVTIRPDITKFGRSGTLGYGATTSKLLLQLLGDLRELDAALPAVVTKRLFRSASRRNFGQPLSLWTWNKVVKRIGTRAGLPQFHTHTLRHVRLTHMARAGLDIYEIRDWALHKSVTSTEKYIHLSGRQLIDKVAKNTALLEQQLKIVGETMMAEGK